ncbi:hypothetical protein [Dyella koreensis]|uniref:DUF2188 domain-containing protein n=1 Tax=Dyella koreensis TaxID=311235 RepID=A0ABW8K7E4_9GAMM
MVTYVEYHVSHSENDGWSVFRNDEQIGHRGDLFEAVAFATHFAEREAALPDCMTRVAVQTSGEARRIGLWSAWRG